MPRFAVRFGSRGMVSAPVARPLPSPTLRFDLNFDLHVGGRNCDRAVERSTLPELSDQFLTLFLGNALEREIDAHRVEETYVGSNWGGTILSRLD